MIVAAVFLLIIFLMYSLSIAKDPIWGLYAYAIIYFSAPSPDINWWAEGIPDFRWSYLSIIVLLISLFIHRKENSNTKLGFLYYLIILIFFIIEILTYTLAVSPSEAAYYSHNMLGYCIVVFIIIKVISNLDKLRNFLLLIISLSACLCVQALIEGEFSEGRLNNIGPADAHSSNEFGLLLAAVIPLMAVFFIHGKKHEKITCFLALPFIINGFTLTVSRGALLAMVIGVLYVFLLTSDRKIKKYILISIIIISPVFVYMVDDSYVDRISSLWNADTTSEQDMDSLSSGRIAIWKYSFDMLTDYPHGAGPGGFRALSRFYMPEEILSYHPGVGHGVRAAHNTYLLVMVELGFGGAVVFILIILTALSYLYKCFVVLKVSDNSSSFLGMLVVVMNISIVATLAGGMVGSSFYYEFFWWQLALIIVLRTVVKHSEILLKTQQVQA